MLVDVTVQTPVVETFRAAQVRGMFDLTKHVGAPDGATAPGDAGDGKRITDTISSISRERFTTEVPGLDEPWHIGLIVGPSGSGKSTVARAAFPGMVCQGFDWPRDKPVVDGFPPGASMREITQWLAAVGFSSPPAWLRPWHVLSNGEKFRCDLARLLLAEPEAGPAVAATARNAALEMENQKLKTPSCVVMDEFTSVVDRQVAKIGSAALAKALRSDAATSLNTENRKLKTRFVAVSCHYDIAEWLQPDWIVDMATCTLARGLLQRPKIQLEVRRCHQGLWPMFKRHHYLSGNLPAAPRCYVGLAGVGQAAVPVAFAAMAPVAGFKGYWRFSRLVVLPDYQGLGLGGKFRDAVANIEAGRPGLRRLSLVTSHPAMIRSLARSGQWRCGKHSYCHGDAAGLYAGAAARSGSPRACAGRIVVSFVYQGNRHDG